MESIDKEDDEASRPKEQATEYAVTNILSENVESGIDNDSFDDFIGEFMRDRKLRPVTTADVPTGARGWPSTTNCTIKDDFPKLFECVKKAIEMDSEGQLSVRRLRNNDRRQPEDNFSHGYINVSEDNYDEEEYENYYEDEIDYSYDDEEEYESYYEEENNLMDHDNPFEGVSEPLSRSSISRRTSSNTLSSLTFLSETIQNEVRVNTVLRFSIY